MKKLLLVLLLLVPFLAKTQCTTASYGQYPGSTYNPTCGVGFETITTCGYRGEYSVVSVTNGNTYTFQSSISSDYITIADGSNSPLVYGTGSQTWVATYDGTVRFYTHVSSACDNASGCMVRSVECVVAGPGCLENTVIVNMIDSYGDGWNGAEYTLTDDVGGLIGTGTLSTGSSGADSYCLPDGCYLISVTGGSYPSEVSWSVDVNGTQVSSGAANAVDESVAVNVSCSGPPPPTPPANDDVCSAESVTCNTITAGTTVNATTEGLPTCGVSQTQPGVWYRIEGNGDDMIASLCNTSWDSKISVFQGSCTNLTCLGGMDDNGPACTGTAASYSWSSSVGEVYYILVHGYSSTNAFDLEVTCTPPVVNPGPCTNTSSYTTVDMPVQTTPSVTVGCYYAGEYCQWDGSEAGVAYTVSSSNTSDWITVRSGTFDGPVEVVGTTPLFLNATNNGETYFIHVNTDDLCGIESSCRDITVTRQSALPIVLSYFTAYLTDGIEKTVIIEWETHSQQNNDYFTVYKSYDGYDWSELTKIQGAGNTNSLMSYTTRDENPRPGYQYYKLRQTDYDGNFEEFNPVSVGLEVPRLEVVKVYNQIGQEVSIKTKGILFLVWDNGDITKIINQ